MEGLRMAQNTVACEVRRILGLVLNRQIDEGEDLVRSQESAWDSLKHVEIMFTIEDHFGVQFNAEELAALDSAEALTRAVESRLAA
jgi:acyl carrier protein